MRDMLLGRLQEMNGAGGSEEQSSSGGEASGGEASGELLRLLAHPEEAPSDNQLPWESNGYRKIPETARFRDQRRAAYGEDE